MLYAEATAKLIEKLSKEFSEYSRWLTSLPSDKVLDHAFEYCAKQDILIYITSIGVHPDRVKTLLASSDALDDIYRRYHKMDTDRMYDIGVAINDTADMLKRQRNGRGER